MSQAWPAKCTGINRLDPLMAPAFERLFDARGIDIEGAGIDIDENRLRAQVSQDLGGCGKGERRGDDLVAGTDAERPQREMQCAGAVRDRQRVLRADILRQSFSKRLALGPVVIHPERRDSITSRSSSGPIEGRKKGTSRIDSVVMFGSESATDSVGLDEYRGQVKRGARGVLKSSSRRWGVSRSRWSPDGMRWCSLSCIRWRTRRSRTTRIYSESARLFHATGEIRFPGYTETMPVAQVVYGAGWGSVFGFSAISLTSPMYASASSAHC